MCLDERGKSIFYKYERGGEMGEGEGNRVTLSSLNVEHAAWGYICMNL